MIGELPLPSSASGRPGVHFSRFQSFTSFPLRNMPIILIQYSLKTCIIYFFKHKKCGLTLCFELQIKLIVVGDEGVGKQSLLHIFATNKPISKSCDMPLTEASYTLDIQVHGKPIILYMLHTAGYEEYDRTRYVVTISQTSVTHLVYYPHKLSLPYI